MLSTNFAENSIFKMVPLLTPAIQKESTGKWKTDYTLLDRRTTVVALAAIAAAVATVGLALYTLSPFIIPVGVLAISALVYTILSADLHCAERAIEPRNVEDFCRLEHPSSPLVTHITSNFNLIQRVVALNGDLNKTSDLGDSLLKVAMRQESGEVSLSFEKVRYLLAHGASPLKGQTLLYAIIEKKFEVLPLFFKSLQEGEIALFKKDPHQLGIILNWLATASNSQSPVPDGVISSLFAGLNITLEDLQAVDAIAGYDVPNFFQEYLT
ncbi:MAG: hypothetical protein K0S07_221 [Chlamydiales bacterium]|jgi:hypothetical protein|nr:hypothetical protein [Chlamydiales bacterium]